MHTVNCMSIFVLSRSVKETLQRKKTFLWYTLINIITVISKVVVLSLHGQL